MNDEKYLYISDVREKRNIARSSHNRKPHAGKGGKVMMPSDYMTRKELKAMSGECKSYRMNEPMPWKEFKAMPDDLKVSYIKLLREKFGVPATEMCKMFGISHHSLKNEISRLELGEGKGTFNRNWDKDGWYRWIGGVAEPMPETTEPEPPTEEPPYKVHAIPSGIVHVIPNSGTLSFEGEAGAVLEAVKAILGDAYASMTISWHLVEKEVCDG